MRQSNEAVAPLSTGAPVVSVSHSKHSHQTENFTSISSRPANTDEYLGNPCSGVSTFRPVPRSQLRLSARSASEPPMTK